MRTALERNAGGMSLRNIEITSGFIQVGDMSEV